MCEEILEKVKAKLRPSEREIERELGIANKIIERIMSIKGKHIGAKLCGSLARGTHLRNERDIDIFVLFPESLSREELEREGLRIAREALKGHKQWLEYSEHPYLKALVEGIEVEIVPCYKLSKGCAIKSAVDRSPWHAEFVRKNLKEEQKDEVRLLKAFLKACNCYGADIANEGFSGYLCELLIIKYGNFLECIKHASKWKPPVKIAIKEEHLKECKVEHHIVFPDPCDTKRNVASAVSLETLARFVAASRMFLKKPSEKFFFKEKSKKLNTKLLKKRAILGILMKKGNATSEISIAQLKKFNRSLTKILEKWEFKLYRSKIYELSKSFLILLEFEQLKLSELRKIVGAPVFDEKNFWQFLDKHNKAVAGPWVENERIAVIEKRRQRNAKEAIEEIIENTKKQAKEPLKSMLESAKILKAEKLAKNEETKIVLADFLNAKEPFFN